MIVRENKIRTSSKEVKLAVSYGIPDIRRFVKQYVEALTNNDPDIIISAKTAIITEGDFRHWLERDKYAFAWIEKPWREQLSSWVWYHVVNEGFVIPSSTADNGFILADKAFIRVGRPLGT